MAAPGPGLGLLLEPSEPARPPQSSPEPLPESPPEPPPRLWVQRGRVLVWGAAAARRLRERCRIWGVLVGTPPRRGPARSPRPRLPLQLLPEEAQLLAESGAAAVRSAPGPEGPEDQLEAAMGQLRAPLSLNGTPAGRFQAYRDLWGRGLHLTSGGKFGGDFLVYPGPPARFHAAAIALAPPEGAGLALAELVAAARLGTSVRKTLLLCGAGPSESPAHDHTPGEEPRPGPAYTSLQWRADL